MKIIESLKSINIFDYLFTKCRILSLGREKKKGHWHERDIIILDIEDNLTYKIKFIDELANPRKNKFIRKNIDVQINIQKISNTLIAEDILLLNQ